MRQLFAPLVITVCSISNCANAQPPANSHSPEPIEEVLRHRVPPTLIKTPGPLERLQTSPRHNEWAEVASPVGRKVHTWVVYPKVDHPATTVLVIHENKGLTDWVRALADELAEAGYIAVAPDLLSGTAPGGGGTAEYGSESKVTEAI